MRLRVEGSLRPEWRAKRDYKLYVFSDLMLIARQNRTNAGYTVKAAKRPRTLTAHTYRAHLPRTLTASLTAHTYRAHLPPHLPRTLTASLTASLTAT